MISIWVFIRLINDSSVGIPDRTDYDVKGILNKEDGADDYFDIKPPFESGEKKRKEISRLRLLQIRFVKDLVRMR